MTDATQIDVLAALTHIAREIASYGCNLGSFAYSRDEIDVWHAEALRDRCRALAKLVAMDVELADRTGMALSFACSADPYAAKELAGRFKSLCARIRLTTAIRRHPSAARFATLISAIESGKFTTNQLAFAKTLAAEAPLAA